MQDRSTGSTFRQHPHSAQHQVSAQDHYSGGCRKQQQQHLLCPTRTQNKDLATGPAVLCELIWSSGGCNTLFTIQRCFVRCGRANSTTLCCTLNRSAAALHNVMDNTMDIRSSTRSFLTTTLQQHACARCNQQLLPDAGAGGASATAQQPSMTSQAVTRPQAPHKSCPMQTAKEAGHQTAAAHVLQPHVSSLTLPQPAPVCCCCCCWPPHCLP